MTTKNINQSEKAHLKENGNESTSVRDISNNVEGVEYSDEQPNRIKNPSSRSKLSAHQTNNNNNPENDMSESAYFYSTGSNIVRPTQPSSAVNLHFSASSSTSKNSLNNIRNESSGFRFHLEPSIERDMNSDKIFSSGGRRSKKNSRIRPSQKNSQKKPKADQNDRKDNTQQKKRNQRAHLVEESPDSYQLSDNFADRDVNLSDESNANSNDYTYEYISESNSYYRRNLPKIQNLIQQQEREARVQQGRQQTDIGDDSEYTYTYELPSSDSTKIERKTIKPSNSYYEDDSEYTYTYDSVSGFNDDYRRQMQQKSAIDAELVPQNAFGNDGTPLVPIQMQLRVPGIAQQPVEQESTNEYTYTYDEPTTEEKMLLKNREIELATPANNFSISNVQQVAIPPSKEKGKKSKRLSPRKMKIQEKISKLQKNLEKLENLPDEEEEETVDINDNRKINSLKNKLANLAGWRNSKNGSNSDTNAYTYTFEYESEVFPQKQPVELQLASPMYSISIEASKKSFQVEERNVSLNDKKDQKINLSISPAVQSEASDHSESRKKKAEQLQEIVDLKLRLQQLQKEYNENHEDDEDNFTYEEPNSNESSASLQQTNKVRIKKRVRVSKQVKLSGDLKNQQKKAPKMKKIHKKVKIEKTSSHHHHHSHHSSNDGSNAFKSDQENENNNRYENDEELVTRDVVINENDDYYERAEESTQLQLLDECSSPASSSTTAALLNFASPKSPIKLLDEGSDEEEENNENEASSTLNVKIADVEGLPNVDVFCIGILDVTGEAKRTKTVQQGKAKAFNQQLTFQINDNQDGHLLLLVKKQDLIKNDKLLGKAKIDLDFNSLKAGEEIDTKVQLNSDAGIPTQSQVHLIISLDNASHDSIIQREVQLQNNEAQQLDQNRNETQQINKNYNETQQLNKYYNEANIDRNKVNNDEEEEDEDEKESELKPSNARLTNEMKNKLKIHKNNFISPKTNDESGIFILEPPSQSALDAELNPSSSFITDLVRSKESTDNNSRSSKSNSNKNNKKNINFTKGDKITYNLENDVKLNQRTTVTREVDLDDDDNDDRQKSNKNDSESSETKKKRRIEPLNNENNNNCTIYIDIYSEDSRSFNDNEDYSDYYSDVN